MDSGWLWVTFFKKYKFFVYCPPINLDFFFLLPLSCAKKKKKKPQKGTIIESLNLNFNWSHYKNHQMTFSNQSYDTHGTVHIVLCSVNSFFVKFAPFYHGLTLYLVDLFLLECNFL